jgi:hypothetical protein
MFELVIGITESLQEVTTSNYSAVANLQTEQLTAASTKFSQSALASPVVAWSRSPTVDVPLTLGPRIISVPQLPSSKSNGSQGLNSSSPLTNSLTHQPTRSTPLH